jgi:hypothetical protein
MSTILSRRKLLAGASAGAVAATTPALAVALPDTGVPDAGVDAFQALAARMIPLAAEIRRAWAVDKRDQEDFEARLASLMKNKRVKGDRDYTNEYWQERSRVLEEHPELHVEHSDRREWHELHGELFPLAAEILEHDVNTTEDLGIQVLAYMTAWNDMFEDEGPLADFFRSLCSFLKMPVPTTDPGA